MRVTAIELGLSNSRLEALNSKLRLINHRSFGIHSAEPPIALIYPCCGAVTVTLPTRPHPHERHKTLEEGGSFDVGETWFPPRPKHGFPPRERAKASDDHAPSRLWTTRSISLMPTNGTITPPRP